MRRLPAWSSVVAALLTCASAPERGERRSPPQQVGGLAVADVNGDGYADLVAGLPGREEYGHETPGRVAVWFGGKGGLRARPAATFVEPAIGQGSHLGSFGRAVVAVGDVNRDGFADVLVGAPGTGSCTAAPGAKVKVPPLDGGRVYLLAGGRAGVAATPAALVDGARMGGRFGSGFRGAGDLDGDGTPEVIIDAPGDGAQICHDHGEGVRAELPDPLPSEQGIFSCRPSGCSPWSSDAAKADRGRYVLTGDFNRDGRADLVSSRVVTGMLAPPQGLGSGDVNGDGIPDLAVGRSDIRRGRLYFYPGAAGRGISEPPAATFIGPLRVVPGVTPTAGNEVALAQTSFGMAVVVIDVDHDGFADIVVGAPWVDKIYVYAGSRAGPREPARQVLSREVHTWFPDRMVAGDFDADGYGDIAITDVGSDVTKPPRGPTLTVYRGSAAGFVTKPALSVALADVVE